MSVVSAMAGRPVLRRLLKAYLAFAGAHALWKLWRRVQLFLRARATLKGVAGASFNWLSFDWLGLGVLRNFNNYFDYRCGPQLAHPTAPIVCAGGPFVEVMCNDRASVKHILKDDFQAFTKTGPGEDYVFQMLGEFLGTQGIFTVRHGKGEGLDHLAKAHGLWVSQRKTASKIFTKGAFSSLMTDTFSRKAKIVKSTLLGAAGTAPNGSVVDFQQLMFRFTFDSIQKVFFDRDVDSVSGRDTDAYAVSYDRAHRAMTSIYLNYVPFHVAAQMHLPWPLGTLGTSDSGWSLTMAAVRRFAPEGAEFAHWCSEVHRHTRDLVRAARSDPKLASRTDLLANFINTGNFSNDELCQIVLHFIIAGRDTTACTLSWLFFNLSCRPELQARVAAAVDEATFDGTKQTLTYDTVQSIPLLTACVYESLRLNPPVPEDFKIASRDSIFPDGTRVPAGTKVTFHNYALGRNPELYPDPLTFKPERWLAEDGSLLPLDTFFTPVFQAGYRECLGKSMALLEVQLLACALLGRSEDSPGVQFSIDAEEQANVTWALMITQSVSNSLKRDSHQLNLRVRPRVAE